jgi:hypothetical protein
LKEKKKSSNVITQELAKGIIPSTERLIQLYDSRGITPQEIAKIKNKRRRI